MCGIYGIVGKEDLLAKTMNGLYELEYRGYDSSGIAYLDENNNLCVHKQTGKIQKLEESLAGTKVKAKTIISHTRWATNGKISNENAHPHYTSKVAIVHNGIITNYGEIKAKLEPFYSFYGECDSEVIAKLIDYYLVKNNDYLSAFRNALSELKGSYAILCIIEGLQDTILVARKESPVYVCSYEKDLIASSDLITFPQGTKKYYEIQEDEICEMKNNKITFFNFDLKKIKNKAKEFNVSENKTCLNGYEYYMIKEINDIPKTLYDTFKNFSELKWKIDFNSFDEIHFVACGTAYHSACVGAFMVQSIAHLPAYSHISSEFIDAPNRNRENHLYIFISQSGETFDTISALKKVKAQNCTTLTITNTTYSSLANLSDYVLPIVAGKEVAVASTKAYNACNLACLFLAHCINEAQTETSTNLEIFERAKNKISINYNEITRLINASEEETFAKTLKDFKTVFFIGKGEDFITAQEASLKLKEISYINCCAYPSGELKHGTLALVDSCTLVVAILTNSKYNEKIASSLNEIKARGGKILLLTNQTNLPADIYDYLFMLDEKDNSISAMLYSIIPLQKLAYYTAIEFGYCPDKPRNLAKSVTVG